MTRSNCFSLKVVLLGLLSPGLTQASPASTNDTVLTCPAEAHRVGAPPPKGTEYYCALPDGTRHGPYRQWYGDGMPLAKLNYRKGKEHGQQESWWPNGAPMMRGISVDGKRYQGFEYWDLRGQPRTLNTPAIPEGADQVPGQ